MDSQNKYRCPPYLSEEVDGNKMLITWEIKGLQKKSKSEAKNAILTKEFDERSMCITVDGTKGKLENKHFQLKIRKLPGEIIREKCTMKLVDDNLIEIHLLKAEKGPWEFKNGLETYKEEVIDKE